MDARDGGYPHLDPTTGLALEARPLDGMTELSRDSPALLLVTRQSQSSRFRPALAADSKKIQITGGRRRRSCDLPTRQSILIGGSWNRNGVIIFGDVFGGVTRASAIDGGCTAHPATGDAGPSVPGNFFPTANTLLRS